eukprot:TRINITY_DN2396_c0_g1_i1.p1 TRINITY_DN2396_c0_g1~~TRINITY_DN2396_c0_g1_i1.p1  ORF type:complete len:325 (+),score=120.13 TRINITY_DN2396_c0_g1_i1:50-976(+)
MHGTPAPSAPPVDLLGPATQARRSGAYVDPHGPMTNAEVSFSQIPAAAPQPSGYASQPPPTYAPGDIEAVLGKYDITIAKADDMHVLQNYKIVFIADDSGSMRLSATNGRRMTRWEELQGTLSMLVEVSSAISKGIGIDVHFLNRGGVMNVQPNDSRLQQALQAPPQGGTPLVECLSKLLRHYNQGKPVLFIIATDGEPSEGPRAFKQLVTQVVQGKLFPNGNTTFKFQIMACTDDDDEVGWLDKLDRKFKDVDVTDDFETERRQVLRTGRKRFSRGDYLTKALLGPISTALDGLDESKGFFKKCSIM